MGIEKHTTTTVAMVVNDDVELHKMATKVAEKIFSSSQQFQATHHPSVASTSPARKTTSTRAHMKTTKRPRFKNHHQIMKQLSAKTFYPVSSSLFSRVSLQDSNHGSRITSDNRVNITVYYESYCPDSIRFITKQLYPAWMAINSTVSNDNGGIKLNLELIPFGKADWVLKVDEDEGEYYDFTCQHGDKECVGNTIQTCVIHYSGNNSSIYIPIINCIEALHTHEAKQCVEESALDWHSIEECTNGKEGNLLLYEAGVKTKALGDIKYIPRIHVNGEFTEMLSHRAEMHLLSVICQYHKGIRPSYCP